MPQKKKAKRQLRKKKVSRRKNVLDPIDRAILQTLTRRRAALTPNEIANDAIMGWATAKKRLQKLQRLKKVKKTTKGKRTFWSRK